MRIISGTGMHMSGLIDDTKPSRDPERVFKVQPTQDSTQVSRKHLFNPLKIVQPDVP